MHSLWKLKCLNNTLAPHLKESPGSRITLVVMAVQADGLRLWAGYQQEYTPATAVRATMPARLLA
jgi:hypothetical protein